MKVFVLGGTGFLGYYTVLELLRRGHEVTVLALDLPEEDLLPRSVAFKLANLDDCTDEELKEILAGQDAVVFAIGADDRVIPKAPAYEFFYNANVRTTERVFRIAREAGVRKGVVCGSYFAYFDRVWSEKKMSEHHPYVRVRQEQARAAFEASGTDLETCVLELPYIFGGMPGRKPLWAPLVEYVSSPWPLFYTKGGTNMLAVERVAEAIAGAVERGKGGETYTVGDENLTWTEMLKSLSRTAGREKRVISIPNFIVKFAMWALHIVHKLQGREGGLNLVEFASIQTSNTFFDPSPSREALGYSSGGLEEALRETVEATEGTHDVEPQQRIPLTGVSL